MNSYRLWQLLGHLKRPPRITSTKNNPASSDILDLVGKSLPIATLLIICLGYFNIHTYYHFFGIKIYNYLDVSEIIFSFVSILDEIFMTLLGVIGAIIVLIVAKDVREGYISEIRSAGNWINKAILYTYAVIMLVSIVYSILKSYFYEATGLEKIERWIINFLSLNMDSVFLILFVVLPAIIIYFLYVEVNADKSLVRISITASLLVAFFAYIYVRNYVFSFQIKRGIPYNQVELICLNGKQVKSNKMWLFIGATKNYYFFSNVISHTNMIIPSSQVIEERNLLVAHEGFVSSNFKVEH